MKFKTTLILLALTIAVAGYILFVERHRPGTKERIEKADRLVDIDAAMVDEIRITRQDGNSSLVLSRQAGGKWMIQEPVKARADSARAGGLATRLELLEADRFVRDPDMVGLGLDRPRLEAEFEVGGKTVKLAFGREDPTSRRVYVAVGSRVAVVEKGFFEALDKPSTHFRDKKVFPVDSFDVDRVSIKYGTRTVAVSKKGSEWFLDAPVKQRADRTEVERLVDRIASLEVSGFKSDRAENLARFGLDPPAAVIELGVFEAGTGAKDKEVLLLSAERSGKRTAKLESEPFIVEIDKARLEGILNQDLSLLKDRDVFHLSQDEIDMLEIVDGQERLLLQKKHEGWKIDGKQDAATYKVEERLRALLNLRADRVVSKPGMPAVEPKRRLWIQVGAGTKKQAARVAFVRKGNVGSGPVRSWIEREGDKELLELKLDIEKLFSADPADFISSLASPKQLDDDDESPSPRPDADAK